VNGTDPFISELEAKYGPAPTWRRFRAERDADREQRARIEEARGRLARGESPYSDDLPF
jgi:hypothetical protein